MNWQEIRTIFLDKSYDIMCGVGMICATSLFGTLAIATPILVLKWLTSQICK